MNKNKNTEQLLKVIKNKEDEFYFGLYLLKHCYKTILDILETFCGGFFNIPDSNLNSSYLQCLKQIGVILNSQKKIKKVIGEPPKLFESLVGDIEEANQEWELGYRQAARTYYGKIENLFIKHGSRNYELPEFIQGFFSFTKTAIKYHKNTENTYKKLFGLNKKKKKIIELNGLTLDLTKATLQYKKSPSFEISPTSQEIRLLLLLASHKNQVMEYKDLAKELDLNCYHEKVENKDVSRDVQFIKRDLTKILGKAGMMKAEINRLILIKTNVGYKLASL